MQPLKCLQRYLVPPCYANRTALLSYNIPSGLKGTSSVSIPDSEQHFSLKLPKSSLCTKKFNGTSLYATSAFNYMMKCHTHSIHVPDYSSYKREAGDPTRRAFTYMLVGSATLLSANAVKNTVTNFLGSLSASADVLALARIEIDLQNIPEGKNLVVKWRGKPVFIRHRTAHEIEEANAVPMDALKDPQLDSERVKDPEWLVLVMVHITMYQDVFARVLHH
jgi:phosphate/sulfate permease